MSLHLISVIKSGKMKKEFYKAYIALAIVSFFWGTTYIASRIGAQHMPGLICSRITSIVFGNYIGRVLFCKGLPDFPNWEVLKKISVQSVFMICIANGLLTWSVEYISGGLAAIIAALVPLFIVHVQCLVK